MEGVPSKPEHIDPVRFHFNTRLVELGLVPEYLTGTSKLINTLTLRGIRDFSLIGFGSLTQPDANIRPDPAREGYLLSDADFLCITKTVDITSPSALLLNHEVKEIGRQENLQKEPPFSEHIPNFDVKIHTHKNILTLLQDAEEQCTSLSYKGEDFDDWSDNRRLLNTPLGPYFILRDGNLMHGDLPREIAAACTRVEKALAPIDAKLTELKERAK